MLKLDSIIPTIVKDKLKFGVESDTINKAIVISVDLHFNEWFADDKKLMIDTVNELNEKFKYIHIDQNGIEARVTLNFLYINKDGYYSCFFNNDRMALYTDETIWKFTTNHDTCWRDNSFTLSDNIIDGVKDEIMEINNILSLDHIDIPKHIISNYSDLSINGPYEISQNLCQDYKKINHTLTNKDGKLDLNVTEVL